MDPRLSSLRLADIRAYLLRKGWREVEPDRPVVVFEEPTASEDGPLYQWVPDSEQRREYPQAMYELLAAVAEVEGRHAGAVLDEIFAAPENRANPANGGGAASARPVDLGG